MCACVCVCVCVCVHMQDTSSCCAHHNGLRQLLNIIVSLSVYVCVLDISHCVMVHCGDDINQEARTGSSEVWSN